KLVVYVVENHNEVLEPLYRLIGKKKLPFDGMCLLHFDSHSDISVPQKLYTDLDGNLNKYEVFSAISIENWIIPSVYSGHISEVVWVHPYWTHQSFDTQTIFKVGRSKLDNSLKVSSTDNYFLSEDSHEFEENLSDCKTLQFHLHCVPPANSNAKTEIISNDLIDSLQTSRFILDIDLDFFSTKNPFKHMFTERQYELLQNIYKYHPPLKSDLKVSEIDKRKLQIQFLEKYFTSVQKGGVLLKSNNTKLDEKLKELVDSLKQNDPCYDFEWLHEIGTGIDDTNLPDHVSSEHEIDYLISYLEKLLIRLPEPLVVLISRLVFDDDYCPAGQVDNIQEKVLNLLKTLYKNVDI
ncbi:hypothetical protein HELRODRAFT_132401, partial [Helobdella robusta]|uniref:Uncharacterized protein n=1 Tax=Helobdella robusta TaxID=6412 RepID=T1EHY4_HELRO